MAELKTQPNTESVEAFLDRAAVGDRRADCATLVEMMRAATGEEPVMWGPGIVGFGRYRYQYESGRKGEFLLIGFSPRKSDLTLYIMPGFDRYPELMARLGKHKTGKSCLYLKKLADVDLAVLRELMAESVQAMSSRRVTG